MTGSSNRTARVEARLSPKALALVKRAAEIEGRSVSDFVVTAAQDAARRTIADIEMIRLSREAQEKFAKLLLDPPRPSPGLKHAFKQHRRLIGEVR
jgi:uncharacterized protein (DUF1778 family)